MNQFLLTIARSSEFWSAIAGAVVGGLIALVIQMVALRAAATDRKMDALEKKKALGHALLFKMLQIHSHLRALNTHMKNALALARQAGQNSLTWQVTQPFANLPQKVHFSTDEMGMLLSLKVDTVFNALASFDEVHNSTVDVFQTYGERRESLTAMLTPNMVRGNVGTIFLTDEEARRFTPLTIALDGLLATMLERCERDETESWDVLTQLQKALHEKIGLAYRLEAIPDAELEARRQGARPANPQ